MRQVRAPVNKNSGKFATLTLPPRFWISCASSPQTPCRAVRSTCADGTVTGHIASPAIGCPPPLGSGDKVKKLCAFSCEERMTSLILRKCECGIEFRIINARDGKSQTLVCECQREIEILGSVMRI